MTVLYDLTDCIDGGSQQRLELVLIVSKVYVSDAHKQDVRWQARQQTDDHTWFQI
jgi:hypothetical protein